MAITHHDDLELFAGDNWAISGILLDVNGVALDLTGAVLDWVLIDPTGSQVAAVQGAVVINVTTPLTLGHVTIIVPAQYTEPLLAGRYHDALRVTLGGKASMYWVGSILVSSDPFSFIPPFQSAPVLNEYLSGTSIVTAADSTDAPAMGVISNEAVSSLISQNIQISAPAFAATSHVDVPSNIIAASAGFGTPIFLQTTPNPLMIIPNKLVAYWDATRGDSIVTANGGVSSWFDLIAGYELKAADIPSQPLYSNNGLNGSPCLTFDTTQYLTCTDAGLLAALPSGAAVSEIWVLVSQDADPADATTRYIVAYGGTSLLTGRALARVVNGGVNQAKSYTGDGTTAFLATNITTPFNGVHVVRQVVSGTATQLLLDSDAANTVAVVPGTINNRLRVGSISAAGASNNYNGKIGAVFVTNAALTAGEATQIHNYYG